MEVFKFWGPSVQTMAPQRSALRCDSVELCQSFGVRWLSAESHKPPFPRSNEYYTTVLSASSPTEVAYQSRTRSRSRSTTLIESVQGCAHGSELVCLAEDNSCAIKAVSVRPSVLPPSSAVWKVDGGKAWPGGTCISANANAGKDVLANQSQYMYGAEEEASPVLLSRFPTHCDSPCSHHAHGLADLRPS